METFKTKQRVIQAVRWCDFDSKEVDDFVFFILQENAISDLSWVIKDENGQYSIMSDIYFQKLYEPLS